MYRPMSIVQGNVHLYVQAYVYSSRECSLGMYRPIYVYSSRECCLFHVQASVIYSSSSSSLVGLVENKNNCYLMNISSYRLCRYHVLQLVRSVFYSLNFLASSYK